MPPEIDVVSCLQRWRQGDEDAAAELVRHLYPVISRVVSLHLPRREQEEDLIQEILMKTFSRLHQFKGDAPLSHWVSRLALTTCLDRLRAAKVRPEVRWADLTPAEEETFVHAWAGGKTSDAGGAIEARDLVEKILSTLGAEDRSLVLMADLEGRSMEEISTEMGWGVSKIKMRLFRLRLQLRQTLHRLGERQ